MTINYSGLNDKGNEVNVFIKTKELQQKKQTGKTSEDLVEKSIDTSVDFRVVLTKIVLDVLSKNKDKPHAEIHVELQDIQGDDISYVVKGEEGNTIHKMSVNSVVEEQNRLVEGIARKHIVQHGRTKSRLETLLERFSESAPSSKGILAKLTQTLATFFTKIRNQFQWINRWWEGLHKNEAAARLKWDLTILSEICGAPWKEELSLSQALHYMSAMLDRENPEVADAALHKRVKEAATLADQLEKLRHPSRLHSYQSRLEKMTKKLMHSIEKLESPQKMLLPVGYYTDPEKRVEMLLEISKDEQGNFTVVLISQSAETEELFDQQKGITTTSRSIRREIKNVRAEQLLAVIPSLIELQTSPYCQEKVQNGKELFLQLFQFDGSTVSVGKMNEVQSASGRFGHLAETLNYVKEEYGASEAESKLFDLSARLRFFLDICKNHKGLKDREFWTAVRTTTLQLASLMERDKSLLVGTAQGTELTHVYRELQKVLDNLEANTPELRDLRLETLDLDTFELRVPSLSPTPILFPATKARAEKYPLDPPFQPLDVANPLKTIVDWGARCDRLVSGNQQKLAGQEAKLMLRMMPKPSDPFWAKLTAVEAESVLKTLLSLGTAIKRAVESKSNPTLQDILSLFALTFYAAPLTEKFNRNNANLKYIFEESKPWLDKLRESRVLEADLTWLDELDEMTLETADPKPPTFNTSYLVGLGNLLKDVVKRIKDTPPASGNMTSEYGVVAGPSSTPLNLMAPEYAKSTSQEITNRYVSEQCCLGCMSDNCANYATIPLAFHRIHPLYMVHNNIETFCPHLTSRFPRDEVEALMYTQQTNQHGNDLWQKHARTHGYGIADHFDGNDQRIQILNTFAVYFNYPHFFKHADLRWHFEIKVLNNRAFEKLLEPQSFKDFQPFVESVLKKLQKEIAVSIAAGETDAAAYLLTLAENLTKIIDHSKLSLEQKTGLKSYLAITEKADQLFVKWTRELLFTDDEAVKDKQKMVFSLMLNRYYQKLCQNSNAPCFQDEKKLEVIMSAIMRLEQAAKKAPDADPEVVDKYLSLRSFLIPQIMAKIKDSRGGFANKVLMTISPEIAAKNLAWEADNFPTLTAVDGKQRVEFNFFTGKFSRGQNVLEPIPEELKEHPIFKQVFGDKYKDEWAYFEGRTTGKLGYQGYVNPQFPNLRITVKIDDHVTIIEKSIQNEKGEYEWLMIVAPGQIAHTVAKDRFCWLDSKKEKVYVYDTPNASKPYAILHFNPRDPDQIQDIQLMEEDLHFLKTSDVAALQSFTLLDSPAALAILGKEGKASSVTYSRYAFALTGAPLTYDLTEEGITTRNFPGYKLEKFGVRPGKRDPVYGVTPLPESFDGFHLLQKGTSQKVLIPLIGYKQQFNNRGEPLLALQPLFLKKDIPGVLFEYTVNPENNRLVAQSGDAYAYLAYICMAHGDHHAAAYYLAKASTSTGYGENYDTIFNMIKDLQDETPNGIAMKLHVALFEQRVLEERTMQQVRAGNAQAAEQLETTRAGHLISIADAYQKYVLLQQSRKPHEEGIDPSLDISPDEELQVKSFIAQLLKQRGRETIPIEKSSQFIRAQAVASREYSAPKFYKGNFYINDTLRRIWEASANRSKLSSLTFKDPSWIIDSFCTVYNELVTLPLSSVRFQQLEQHIRLIPENKKNEDLLANKKNEELLVAQSILLKIISLKKMPPNELDPVLLNELKPMTTITNPDALFKMQTMVLGSLQEVFTRSLYGPFIENRWKTHEKDFPEKFMASLKEVTQFMSITGMRYLRYWWDNELEVFLQNWAKDNTKKDSDFPEAFRNFVIKKVLGQEQGEVFFRLETLFQLLSQKVGEAGQASDLFPVKQPEQEMEIPQNASGSSQPLETYQSKYGKLIETVSGTSVEPSQVAELEKQLQNTPEPAPAKKVVTDPKEATVILWDVQALKANNLLFSVKDKPAQAVSEKVFDQLESHPEKAVQRFAKENREDLKAYLTQTQEVTISKAQAENLKGLLQAEQEKASADKEKKEKELLQFVERWNTPAGVIAMRRLTGKAEKPSLDFIIRLWRKGELDVWPKKLSESELQELDQKIADYLKLSVKGEHINRTLETTTAYLSSYGASGDSLLAEEIYDSLTTKRHFALDATKSPDYRDLLFLEYTQGIVLRDTQIQTFRDLVADPNAVGQLRMGGGKSKVLSPLLAKRKANGKNLVILLYPDELFETNLKDQDATNRQLFMQTMPVFLHCRSSDKSEKSLLLRYKTMLETIRDRGFMPSTKGSLLSFRDDYLNFFADLDTKTKELAELYYSIQPLELRNQLSVKEFVDYIAGKGKEPTIADISKVKKEFYAEFVNRDMPLAKEYKTLLGQIRIASKIMKLLEQNTDVLCDELDACLDVRKEVNFSRGESKPIDEVRADIGYELMELALASKKQLASMPAPAKASTKQEAEAFSQLVDAIEKNTQASISAADRKKMMGILAATYFDKHRQDFPAEMTREAFSDYVLNKDTEDTRKVEAWVFTQKVSQPLLFKKITALKAFTSQGYGSTLGRVGKVHFGRDPISEIWTIPYKGSNSPSVGSEFDDDIEQVSNTYVDYMQNGVSYKKVYAVIAEFQQQALQEMRNAKEGETSSLEETEAGKQFIQFIKEIDPDQKLSQLITLSTICTPKKIAALTAAINSNLSSKLAFCHMCVVRKIKQFPAQVSARSADITGMVHNFGGFTGTPWNKNTYDDKMHTQMAKGVDGFTWALLLGREMKVVHFTTYDAEHPVDSVLQGLNVVGNYQALIDRGAFLREVDSNEEVGQRVLEMAAEKGKPINGAIYFDANGTIVKKTSPEESALPIEIAPSGDRMKEFTFYDGPHTVGTDIKQGRTARGIMTTSDDSFHRDYGQALWRFRQIHKGQQMDLASQTHTTKEAILVAGGIAQARREAEDNFRAEKEKIQGFTKRLIVSESVDLIASVGASDEQIVAIAHHFATDEGGLFIKKRAGEESYDEFGKIKTEESPQQNLERAKAAEKVKCTAAQELFDTISARAPSQQVKDHIANDLVNRPKKPDDWFPEKVETSMQEGGEVEQQAQAEVEQELTLTLETKTMVETQTVTEPEIPIATGGQAGSGNVKRLESAAIHDVINGKWSEQLRQVHSVFTMFDPGIFMSEIFERNLPMHPISLLPSALFYSRRKPILEVMITKSGNNWDLFIPTIHEIHSSCAEFIKAPGDAQAAIVTVSPTPFVTLYKTGEDRSDAIPFTSPEDKKQFYRLYVQAKLLNGEIEFKTDEEKEALKAWLQEKGVQGAREFRDFFEKHILAAKLKVRIAGYKSTNSLYRIFEEVCNPQEMRAAA